MITTRTVAGNYLYVSPACRQLLGYEPEELVGRSFSELLHPEDAAALRRTQSIINQLPDQYIQSYRIQRSDGTFIWLETTNRVTNIIEHNSPVIISISRDITERKQAEVTIVSLNQVTVGELRSLADKKNLTLELQIQSLDDYRVINDKKCLRRILIFSLSVKL
ncbi:MAG: PAS domain S-box protein [Cyanobacteria bacterium J06592_8]